MVEALVDKSPDLKDDWPAPTQWSNYPDARAWARLFSLAILAYLIAWAAGFAFVSRVFGLDDAMFLSLIPVFPLIVAIRLRRRWPAVRGTELILLLLLLTIASGGGVFVVRDWFDKGMDHRHAEDVQWAEFGVILRKDPAFKNVEIKKSLRKNIYWVDGVVATEADLDRLQSLATRCGISGRSLDGPFQSSVSLIVEGSNRVRTD
jgi:hypothetical protein